MFHATSSETGGLYGVQLASRRRRDRCGGDDLDSSTLSRLLCCFRRRSTLLRHDDPHPRSWRRRHSRPTRLSRRAGGVSRDPGPPGACWTRPLGRAVGRAVVCVADVMDIVSVSRDSRGTAGMRGAEEEGSPGWDGERDWFIATASVCRLLL